jgi:hypothetical protein
MMKIEINTDKYEWVWGKRPKGKNSWFLKVYVNYREAGIIDHNGRLNKAEVKKAVLRMFPDIERKGEFTKVDVEVMA